MLAKQIFKTDFEIHASPKILYYYLQTAGGLAQWFADDVKVIPEMIFSFIWENEEHKAKQMNVRFNHSVKYEYLPEMPNDKTDPSYFELRVEWNELTQTSFLYVTDYSDFGDSDELQQFWHGMIGNLKDLVGG